MIIDEIRAAGLHSSTIGDLFQAILNRIVKLENNNKDLASQAEALTIFLRDYKLAIFDIEKIVTGCPYGYEDKSVAEKDAKKLQDILTRIRNLFIELTN
jgi:hypothetical protein